MFAIPMSAIETASVQAAWALPLLNAIFYDTPWSQSASFRKDVMKARNLEGHLPSIESESPRDIVKSRTHALRLRAKVAEILDR